MVREKVQEMVKEMVKDSEIEMEIKLLAVPCITSELMKRSLGNKSASKFMKVTLIGSTQRIYMMLLMETDHSTT